ncbi:hypothetical protein [Ruminococcus flavefaciens]|nr:hypothetical protein [Ruminococcus flavefaciens]
MGRGYGFLDFLFEGIVATADYIADERREKRGECREIMRFSEI